MFKKIILFCTFWIVTTQTFPSTFAEEKIIEQFVLGNVSNEIMRFGISENSKKNLSEIAETVVKNALDKKDLDKADQVYTTQILQIYKNMHNEILNDPSYVQQVKNIFKKHMSNPEIIALWDAESTPHKDIYEKYANASLEVSKFTSAFIEKKLKDQTLLDKYQLEIQKIFDKPEYQSQH